MIISLQEFIRRTDPGHRALMAMWVADVEALREKWLDEASEHALNGNPTRAHYIEQLAGGAA